MNTTGHTHGGRRPGAGRPSLYGKRMVKKTVRLTPEQISYLEQLGNGDLAAGLRHLVDQAMDENR